MATIGDKMTTEEYKETVTYYFNKTVNIQAEMLYINAYERGCKDTVEKACKAYCKCCDTKDCCEEGTCDWIKKFRRTIKKSI